MANTKVKFPRAPTELPMIFISMFNVGQDFANLKTRSWKIKKKYMLLWSIFESITCEVYQEMIKIESLTTFALQML